MTTGAQLIARVGKYMVAGVLSTTTNPSRADALDNINAEQSYLHGELAATYKRRFLASTTMSYGSGLTSTSLPNAVQNRPVLKVVIDDDTVNGRRLDARQPDELDGLVSDGIPSAYALAGTDIMIRPRPLDSPTLTLWYVGAPSALGDDGSVPTWLVDEFHDLLALGAAVRISEILDDSKAQILEKRYSKELTRLHTYYFGLTDDNRVRELVSEEASW